MDAIRSLTRATLKHAALAALDPSTWANLQNDVMALKLLEPPIEMGETYSSSVMELLNSIISLLESPDNIKKAIFSCNSLLDLPTCSFVLVSQQIGVCAAQLNDAIEECIGLENGECFDGSIVDLHEVERLWIHNINGLLKTTFLCMKKLVLLLEAGPDISLLSAADNAIVSARSCSKLSDDLVSFLDLPLDTHDPILIQATSALAKESKRLAEIGKSFSDWFLICDSKLDSFSNLSIE
jgi:hypothetical protein